MTNETLNRIHCQRIGRAVEAARRGEEVRFWIANGAIGGARLVCGIEGRVDVIATGGRRIIEQLLPQAEAEFLRQLELEPAAA
ncbi:MAG TPA: hypothetical protein VHC90_09695 [Bryobacteraceae bacterium]|nr:hypothetical protein [Bryobacteraceae bacterium]